MNEKPKSIWKKSWTGWRRLLLGWLVLMIATMIISLVIMLAIGARISSEEINLSLVVSLCATVGVFLVLFIHWLCCWRNFKRFLFGLACFATLIALFYAEEDWRGLHDWNKFKREREAKGEKFDFKDFVPPPVPDDQNFALTPIVFTSYGSRLTRDGKMIPYDKRDKNFAVRMEMPIVRDYSDDPTNGSGNWTKATLTNLKPWQDYYRKLAAATNLFPVAPQSQTPAQDVLLALSKYDLTIEELREASKLPYSRFPLEWDKDDPAAIMLPHLAVMKSCTRILRLRAIAELQSGQSEKALDDVKLMLYLNQSFRTEPVLISHLVRIAMAEITLQPIYEGLAEHKWSDAQLVELDSELGKLDFLADYEFSMRGERIFGISETEYIRRTRNFRALDDYESGNHSDMIAKIASFLVPDSFFYRSELVMAQMHQQWILPMVDVENRIVSPDTVRRNEAAGEKELKHGWPYNILARMIFPAFESAVRKYAREQSSIDLARVGVALERYRLANENYPDSINALAPQFMEKIPHDIINGQPLHYRRTDDGQFVLYSVGWNEKDDGGVVGYQQHGTVPLYEFGDWVWRYPQK
jgi:tetratricopeptide (TPR) repeat protein